MITVIIPCAGKGERFGKELPKQFLPLRGVPIFLRTLLAFEKHPQCDLIILGINNAFKEYVYELLKERPFKKLYKIIEGGETRQETVFKALLEAPEETEIFLIHDAVRPLVEEELITKVIEGVKIENAVIPGILVRDALVREEEGYIREPLDRTKVYQVQTPQAFRASLLREAINRATAEGLIFPDEGSLLHYYGYKVKIIGGSFLNFKITYPEDFLLAEKLISE